MKIMIDICKSAYKEMCEYGTDRVDYDIQNMIKNAIVLPEDLDVATIFTTKESTDEETSSD